MSTLSLRPLSWSPRPTTHLPLAGVLLFALLLRLYQLDALPIWTDEADVLIFSQASWSELFADFRRPGHNGPLYYVLVKGWLQITNGTLLALRLLSVICGTLCIIPAYTLGNRLEQNKGGLYLSLLIATSPYLIWYSKDGKMYSLLLLLTMTSSLVLLQIIESKRAQLWVIYAFLVVVSWHIHLLSALILPVHALYWLSQQTQRKQRLALILFTAAGIGIGSYLLAWHVPAERIDVEWQQFPTILLETVQSQLFVLAAGYPNRWQLFATILYLSVVMMGLLHLRQDIPRKLFGLTAYFLVPIVLMAFLQMTVNVYATRYLITIAPAFYGLITLLIFKLPQPISPVVVGCLLMINLLAI